MSATQYTRVFISRDFIVDSAERQAPYAGALWKIRAADSKFKNISAPWYKNKCPKSSNNG